jgi:hypothetical protein
VPVLDFGSVVDLQQKRLRATVSSATSERSVGRVADRLLCVLEFDGLPGRVEAHRPVVRDGGQVGLLGERERARAQRRRGALPAVGQRNGKTGTYKLGVLSQPPPQQFNVTLPAAISNGVAAAGAGNLETTASEDVYEFTTAALAGVQVTVSSCVSSLLSVDWKLIEAATGTTIAIGASTCSAKLVPNVPAGRYQLKVTRNGRTGTYKVNIGTG